MDINRLFIFGIFLFIPVQGQVLDKKLADVILISDLNTAAVFRVGINTNYSCVFSALNWLQAYDIDYDPIDDVIYWIDRYWLISSGSISGNSGTTVRSLNGIVQTYGIAVDPLSRLLFYIDSGNVISAISLEDFLHKTIISSGLANPRAIVTDPMNGTIYWADSGSPAKIEKSNYDGTNRQEVVTTELSAPYGLVVDINAGVLYWCDIDIDNFTIEGAYIDGSKRHLIYQEQDTYFGCSIALYKSYIYFTRWFFRPALMRIGTDGSGLIKVVLSEAMHPLGIHVNINISLGINGCSNAGCSHLCFPLPGGYKQCACPDIMTLQPDGQTCRNDDLPDDFMLVSYINYYALRLIDIKNNYSYVNIPFQKWVYVYDIDYDPASGVIFLVDGHQHINSVSIYGNKQTTVRTFNDIAQTYGVALDSISRVLFYTDKRNDIIAAISLVDSFQKTIISSGLVSPIAIVTDPINGTIYWIDSGSPAKIEKSNYDGTNRQELVNTGLSAPYDLDVDINAGVLYWCDISTFKIEGANVDGSNRYLIYQEHVSVSGCSIALYQSYLYFTTWWSSYDLMRIGTDGSGLISVARSAFRYPQAINVNNNGRTGVNGCSNGSGGCSHFCFPLPDGSNVCACPDLMTLQHDGQTCQTDKLPDNFLLITEESNRSIYRMDIDTYSYAKIPLQNLSYPYAIDYDPISALMVWTDLNIWQINSGSIYGNSQTILRRFKNYVAPYKIAVDPISRLLFYIDSERNIIGVISLDDDIHKTVVNTGLNTLQAIVTDPTNGTIYWTSLDKIEKSNYDGTNRQEVISTGISASVDLAVDINMGVIYWCDYNTRTIERANMDGSNRQVLYQAQTSYHKCSIALYHSYLYYSDSAHSFLMRIGTDGSGMTPVGPFVFNNVMDIYAHSNISGNQGLNECSNGRRGCSHFCFPLPGGSYVCDCPDDMTLHSDGLSCVNYSLPKNFLLITDGEKHVVYLLDIENNRYIIISLPNSALPSAVSYDPVDQVIIWIDFRFRQILSTSIKGNTQRIVRKSNLSATHTNRIAVDAISRLLFYTDYENKIIAVISLDGSVQKVVISNTSDHPLAIALDPINGTIYWTTEGNHSRIEKSDYDGTNRQELINTGLLRPYGLTIDIRAQRLYWCDSSSQIIERASLDGSNRQIVYQATRFYKIALSQSHIYFTAWGQRSIYLMRMGTDGTNLTYVGPSYIGYYTDMYLHTNGSAFFDSNGCSSRHGDCSHFCFPRPGGFKLCACPDDLTLQSDGHTCGTYSNECDSSPCQNDGNCIYTNRSYLCECHSGWKGTNCTIDINECTDYPCQNNGTCIKKYGSYLCNCTRGWQGENCSDDVNECESYPCQNDGTCSNTNGSFFCECHSGWKGPNCTVDINECDSSPCDNDGTCSNTNGSFICECHSRWNGPKCTNDVDECVTSPCENGGTCRNTNGTYSCDCLSGWQGKKCSTGSTTEITVLRALVGSLAGLLVISVLLIIWFVRRRVRAHKEDTTKRSGKNPTTGDENKEYDNISATSNTDRNQITESLSMTCIGTDSQGSRSNEQYTTLAILEREPEHDYSELHLNKV